MAHEVETMAYAGDTPWHGLGVPVSNDLSPEEMAVAASVNWRVVKRRMYVCHEAEEGGEPEVVEVPNRFALCRETDGRIFDVVGEHWNPVQNTELLATFRKFCVEGGATMETAGALKGGEIVWGLANLGNGFVLPGGDAVKGYLLLASRHRAGFATIGRLTPVRVVCRNTFAMSGGFAGAAQLRVPHTQEFDPDWAAEQIGIARAGMSEFERNAKLLQGINLGRDDALRLLAPIYQPDAADDLKGLIDNYDERANRTVKGIMESAIRGAGQDTEIQGTGWGLFNGATFYANHKARGTADNRLASTLMGNNNQQLNRLFTGLLELAQ